MKRFKNILLHAAEGLEEPQVAMVADLARRNGATVTTLAIAPEQSSAFRLFHSVEAESVRSALDEHAEEHAQELAKSIAARGVSAVAETARGRPFLKIIESVLRNKHDFVVTLANDAGGGPYSSDTLSLLRKCPAPVWALKWGMDGKTDHVLAAVDPTDPSEEGKELNQRIMEHATSLAEMHQARLVVVHCFRLMEEGLLLGRGRMTREAVDALIEELRETHAAALDELVAPYHLSEPDASVKLAYGEAFDVIPATAEEERADMVVMGTLCRSGIPGFFIGNTAERTLQRMQCSLLAVKPKGFQTPVSL